MHEEASTHTAYFYLAPTRRRCRPITLDRLGPFRVVLHAFSALVWKRGQGGEGGRTSGARGHAGGRLAGGGRGEGDKRRKKENG